MCHVPWVMCHMGHGLSIQWVTWVMGHSKWPIAYPVLHCWYSFGRHVTIGTPMVIFAVLTVFWLFLTVFNDWCTVGTLLVQSWQTCRDWYTNGVEFFDDWYCVRIVKYSQKTNSKKMTIAVQIVTCLHRVRQIHKAAQTPLPRETSITCAWAVATARRPWTRLTLCVYMDVHASSSRSLPYMLLHSLLPTDDACSSSI